MIMTNKDQIDIEDVLKQQQGSDADVVKKLHHLLVERLLDYLEGKTTLEHVFQLSETLYTMEVLQSSHVLQKALELLHGMYEKIGKKEKLTDLDKENTTYMLNKILNDIT
jgi:hypothetical protein